MMDEESVIKFLSPYLQEAVQLEVDYVHLIGGEPTLHPNLIKFVSELVHEYELKLSINSNLTTVNAWKLISEHAEHVAFDIKLPFPFMTGLGNSPRLTFFAKNFMENLQKLADLNFPFEARIPVAGELTEKALELEGSQRILEIVRMWKVENERKGLDAVVKFQPLMDWRDGITPPEQSRKLCKSYCDKRKNEQIIARLRKKYPWIST